jgi:Flp pilus assembly pilin Flp
MIKNNRGATIIEYAFLLTVILIVAYFGYLKLGKQTRKAGDQSTMTFANH